MKKDLQENKKGSLATKFFKGVIEIGGQMIKNVGDALKEIGELLSKDKKETKVKSQEESPKKSSAITAKGVWGLAKIAFKMAFILAKLAANLTKSFLDGGRKLGKGTAKAIQEAQDKPKQKFQEKGVNKRVEMTKGERTISKNNSVSSSGEGAIIPSSSSKKLQKDLNQRRRNWEGNSQRKGYNRPKSHKPNFTQK